MREVSLLDERGAKPTALECGDLSPLLAGDLSPSNHSEMPLFREPSGAERALAGRQVGQQPKRRQVAALQISKSPPLNRYGHRALPPHSTLALSVANPTVLSVEWTGCCGLQPALGPIGLPPPTTSGCAHARRVHDRNLHRIGFAVVSRQKYLGDSPTRASQGAGRSDPATTRRCAAKACR